MVTEAELRYSWNHTQLVMLNPITNTPAAKGAIEHEQASHTKRDIFR
jgi:hypothetical protein